MKNKNLIKLYHYTDKAGLDRIDIAYFGDNYYTLNDTKASQVKRTYFYFNEPLEWRFKTLRYCYTVKVDISKFYDLTIDKLNLKNKFIDEGLSTINFTRLLKYLKYNNFTGAIYPIGNNNIAISFKTLKVIKCLDNLKVKNSILRYLKGLDC